MSHRPFSNAVFSSNGCLSLLEQWHAASITTIPQTAGGGNIETESITQNTEGEDKGKRVTSAEETLAKSTQINTGFERLTGTRLPSTQG